MSNVNLHPILNWTAADLQLLEADLRTIVAEVVQRTGLPTRWNGKAIIQAAMDAPGIPARNGAKNWDCSIEVHVTRLSPPGRYATSLHEALYSVSAGLTPADFRAFKGYEEGVVEQLTRLMQNEIVAALGYSGITERRTAYNRYVLLLENLRGLTQREESAFYLDLLRTPLCNREDTVLQWILADTPIADHAATQVRFQQGSQELKR